MIRFTCPYQPKSSKGPLKFMSRLANALEFRGHRRTADTESHDVRIGLVVEDVEYWHSRNIPVLMRLDGVYHRNDMYFGLENAKIAKSHFLADAIVYQCEFARNMCLKYLGLPTTPLSSVIPNGSSVEECFQSVLNPSPDAPFVLTAAHWRPHKRLKDIINGFLCWGHPTARLFVAGIDTLPVQNPKIIALGMLNDTELLPYFRHAFAFLHLAWIDWCPNAVVEALVYGLPVICTSNGGMPELVKKSGVIIEEYEYDLEPCDLYHPPPVESTQVADALERIYSQDNQKWIDRSDLDINHIAARYEKLIMDTINFRPCLKLRNNEEITGS